MLNSIIVGLVALVVAFAVLGADGRPTIRQVPPSHTSPASGKQMFETHCAACHGLDGRGGGPAVAALKTPPPDLTTLTIRAEGKFPELRVYQTIRGDVELSAHGSKDMPVWGNVFSSMSRDESQLQLRLANLTKYIESIQSK